MRFGFLYPVDSSRITRSLYFFLLSTGFVANLIHAPVSARETVPVLDGILVVPARTNRSLDIPGADMTVFTRSDIRSSGVGSIPELLERVAGIDLVARGTPGSQADVSVRGSSIESVLVLVNGIRASDPQTGHFSLDLPFDLAAVDRVEILTGGGSSVYGPSASGGVINIVTGDGGIPGRRAGLGYGSHRTGEASLSMSGELGSSGFSVAVSGARSAGYREDTDLESSGLSLSGSIPGKALAVTWNAGYRKRNFGAGGFYAPYPSYEETMILQGGVNARYALGRDALLRVRFGGRGHGDKFVLIRDDPTFYTNTHYNRSYSLAAEYLAESDGPFAYVIGIETERLGITSPGLGGHADYTHALYGELSTKRKSLRAVLSARLFRDMRDDTIFSPGVGLGFSLSRGLSLRFRAERSFRTPTYTELYYRSPANYGNPDLESERSLSAEAGLDFDGNGFSAGVTGFVRRTTDVIDWIRTAGETAWYSDNHGRLETTGVDMDCTLPLPSAWRLRLGSCLLHQSVSRRRGTESKYALNPVTESLVATLSGNALGVRGVLSARYERQTGNGDRCPAALSLSRDMGSMAVTLSVMNAFNEKYEVLPGLPAPGRWVKLGVEWRSEEGN